MPPALREALTGMVRTAALAKEAADDLAAATGWNPHGVASNLQALLAARCWKRIPRCSTGWATGLCARTGRHEGDCSPFRDTKGATR